MKKALMVVGTSSHAGKSFIVAALCRILKKAGYRVAPFKAQNMSLNSAVTGDGREIARAQDFQAQAAGVPAKVEMNPILLKPKGEHMVQVVLLGRPCCDLSAQEYYSKFARTQGLAAVKSSIQKLWEEHDILVMEGAGSPAEINLYDQDIANFTCAELAKASVVLVGDIERGGVFASIYGTLELLRREHRRMVKGVIINKFRGDLKVLGKGVEMMERLTGVPVIGVVEHIDGLFIPEEDSQGLGGQRQGKLEIAVLRYPRISNFTDFDPLAQDPRIALRYVTRPEELEGASAIILPGTKSTLKDLAWVRLKGFDVKLRELAGKVPIIGICGGYQMLGTCIEDEGVEEAGRSRQAGLGLLQVATAFQRYEKMTRRVEGKVKACRGVFEAMEGLRISGYEIHMGCTRLLDGASPVFELTTGAEGAADPSHMTFGTYVHGLFDNPGFREAFINYLMENGVSKAAGDNRDIRAIWEESIERMAGVVEKAVDLSWFL